MSGSSSRFRPPLQPWLVEQMAPAAGAMWKRDMSHDKDPRRGDSGRWAYLPEDSDQNLEGPGWEEPQVPQEEPGEVIEEVPPEAAAGQVQEVLEPAKAAPVGTGKFVVRVRVGALPQTGMATTTDGTISPRTPIVIRTSRGTELGVAASRPVPAEGDIGPTLGHVLRIATEADLARKREIEEKLEPEEARYCRQKIKERGLKMKLSGVEHLLGGERIIFYFTAERRVDFRALVRDLAWHFHTRIELRQIGPRDEARLLADFEHCGQPLCCKTFLTKLEPVSMRMAKLQRTTLDPHKISGRCGRLMCCLRFEDEVYKELVKTLPPKGARVKVGSAEGEVVSTDILTQMVAVKYPDGELEKVPVTAVTVVAQGEGGHTQASGAGAEPPVQGASPSDGPDKSAQPKANSGSLERQHSYQDGDGSAGGKDGRI